MILDDSFATYSHSARLSGHSRHRSRYIADDLWLVVHVLHVRAQLLRDLAKHLLGQVAFRNGFVELHKLDDVSGCASASVISEELVVAVELFHEFKFFTVTNTYNHDGARKRRCVDQKLFDSRHVVDCAIGQDQQNVVHILGGHLLRVYLELVDNWSEEGGTSKLDKWQPLLVHLEDALSAWYGWLCRISIYREAMTDRSAWDRYSTESKSWEHLCVIIGL